MRRHSLWLACLAVGLSTVVWSDPASVWKEYENPLVGIRVPVKRAWGEIFLKETSTTGSVTFNISSQPHTTFSIIRQKAEYSFDVWVSSDILLQLYQPGYHVSPSESFAGRPCVKVTGIAKDKEARAEESYFSSRPPFVDEITFASPKEDWPTAEPDFVAIRKSIRWTP